MKAAKKQRAEEPMGIVISGTTQPPESTVFIAYEWSPPMTAEEPKAA